MNRFAALLDRLSLEPRRNAKLALLANYLRQAPDPDRGQALAAMTGALSFRNAKPALIRGLIAERTDPDLFAMSYDYVGDLAETVALMWPKPPRGSNLPPPALSEIVSGLETATRADLPSILARWLDGLDETGRWALLKLITGGLRIGVSARLAKAAVAALGPRTLAEIEDAFAGSAPPYEALFAWAEGRGPMPEPREAAPFRPAMLATAIEEAELAALDPAEFLAEWKWDGIRVQAVAARGADGRLVRRFYSRSGDEISAAFPDAAAALPLEAAIDGELLIVRGGEVQSFNVLQQRLNRKKASPKLMAEFPALIRCYDLLSLEGEDLRPLPFAERRKRLEALIAEWRNPLLEISPLVHFNTWEELAATRRDPASRGADARAVEGVMIKRKASPYTAGRPKGLWFKWKRDPETVDAVLMYAQRGHGKRSSYYSDYTFGVWRGEELVPVGKAYSGFTDEELLQIDKFVRANTLNRFGPVREVAHERDQGLVFEIAFEGLQRSPRHKSGLAMRFPRIARIRWDKKPWEADGIEKLEEKLPV